jgi:chromate transporter
VLFVLPSFLMVWAISVAYVRFGGLPWMQAVFYGVGAAVIGIVVRSAFKLTRLTLGSSVLLWTIGAVMAVTTALTEREIAWLFVLAGLVAVAVTVPRFTGRAPAVSSTPVLFALAAPSTTQAAASLPTIFWFFGKAGAFVFGSGLAIVPFLYGEVVQTHHWLSDREFLDAVAVAMITPGPVVITVAFIGYLMAGVWGMTLAAVGVFLPVYLLVLIPAPYFRRHRSQPTVKAFVDGVSAAATGAIGGAAYVLGTRALTDVVTVAVAVATFVVLSKWKISELWLIAAAAVLGVLVRT